MGIELKRREQNLGEINVDVYKIMTSDGPRKIKSLIVDIFMPSDIDSYKLKVLQSSAEDVL